MYFVALSESLSMKPYPIRASDNYDKLVNEVVNNVLPDIINDYGYSLEFVTSDDDPDIWYIVDEDNILEWISIVEVTEC